MRLAFCIFKYFPFGGLQRDCLEIAQACRERGHEVTLFTREWIGSLPEGLNVQIVPSQGLTNHGRCNAFAKASLPRIQEGQFDLVVGFNKMPGLDLYYAGDPCYQDRARQKYHWQSPIYWMTPRFRRYVALEKAVFDPRSKADIILLVPSHKEVYTRRYGTPSNRFHILPPSIGRDRKPPMNATQIRTSFRREYLRSERDHLLLMVGSSLQGKGLDRTVRAVAALPCELRNRTMLLTVGDDRMEPYRRLAAKLGIADQLRMFSPRHDIQRFFLGADLLMHPAYQDNTGGVILESLAHGLPVITTDVCGYAEHVSAAKAGLVVPSPFRQELLNQFLGHFLASPDSRETSAVNGRSYAASLELYNRADLVASLIEARAARERHALY
jgi:UDP-glucose:(heptosyl)LPS alpha-1,3-glucosyltransferase